VPIDPQTGQPLPYPDEEPMADAGGGGIPPELLAMLTGGAGGEPEPDDAALDEQFGIGGEEEESPGSPADALRDVLGGLQGYMDVEQDDEDLAVAAKVFAQLQSLLAKQQKERDAALGVGPAQRLLRRA
jgi:hypothetical protein